MTTSDNEWYSEWQRLTTSHNELQHVVISANFAFFRIRVEPTKHPKEIFKSRGGSRSGTIEIRAETKPKEGKSEVRIRNWDSFFLWFVTHATLRIHEDSMKQT